MASRVLPERPLMGSAARYYATVLTMAAHGTRPEARARALALLTEALGDGPPPPGRGIYIHDGTRILHATEEVARLLGGQAARLVGRSAMSPVHEVRQAAVVQRIKDFRAGVPLEPTWRGPMVRLDGRPVLCEAITTPIIWEGKPAVQIALVDLTDFARMS